MREKQRKSYEFKLNKKDREILLALEAVVEGICVAFGSNCEAVLHSLDDTSHSIVKIVNGHVTGRKVGAPLTDFGIEILKRIDELEEDVIGSYYSKLENGRPLKSVTILIRNTIGKPIGFICINIDLSAPLLQFLEEFLPKPDEFTQNIVEHYPLGVKELISSILEKVMNNINIQRKISFSEKNKMIVLELYKRGVFNVKGAVDLVAKELGISRYTIYNYLREAKPKELKPK